MWEHIMTTIVTVHGTFANAEEDHGPQWWQLQSEFQSKVAPLIKGKVDWVPFHWSGANLETERRQAGKDLYDFLKKNFEDKGEPYHLVGHSHGGSVIAEALRWSTRKKSELTNLRSWITIATPFLAFKRHGNLFQRVKRRYQLLLVIAIAYAFAVLIGAPMGLCADLDGVDECRVEKTDTSWIEADNISRITPAFTADEITNLPGLLYPQAVATEAKTRLMPVRFRYDFSTPEAPDESLNLSLPMISAQAIKSGQQPPLDAASRAEFISLIKRGELQLDLCAPLNWQFYKLPIGPEYESLCDQITRAGPNNAELEDQVWELIEDIAPKKRRLSFQLKNADGDSQLVQLDLSNPHSAFVLSYVPRWQVVFSFGYIIYLALLLIPVYLFAALIWWSQRHIGQRYLHGSDLKFAEWYQQRWIKLSHPQDEAINSIAAAPKTKNEIAPPDLLQGRFMLLFTCVSSILLILFGVRFTEFVLRVDNKNGDQELIEALGSTLNAVHDVFKTPDIATLTSTNGVQSAAGRAVNSYEIQDVLYLLCVFGVTLLIITAIGRLIEKTVLNPALKSSVDAIANNSLTSGAFGNDCRGEIPRDCAAHPPEFEDSFPGEMPTQVCEAVEAHANRDLTHLAATLRGALHKGAMSVKSFTINELIEDPVEEVLVHTSYFSVSPFQHLFAAALISTGDTNPANKFTNYTQAKTWFEALKTDSSNKSSP
jgi:hypothetical protein